MKKSVLQQNQSYNKISPTAKSVLQENRSYKQISPPSKKVLVYTNLF